jgi:hypothetical protein
MVMDDPMASRSVTLPLWVLDEVMPALLGADKVFEAKLLAGVMPQPFTQADLDRYRKALNLIAEAMEGAGVVFGEAD